LSYYGGAGNDDIDGGKETDDCADNLRSLVVDGKKKFDEASYIKEECRVQWEGRSQRTCGLEILGRRRKEMREF